MPLIAPAHRSTRRLADGIVPFGEYFLAVLELPVVQRSFDSSTVRHLLPAQIDRNIHLSDAQVVELYRAKATWA